MTVHEMRSKMPVREMLDWIAYFNEANKPEDNAIDLQNSTPAQLKGIFG